LVSVVTGSEEVQRLLKRYNVTSRKTGESKRVDDEAIEKLLIKVKQTGKALILPFSTLCSDIEFGS
jgi:L-2-hydroxyglutarate oxidase LhgO